jgi:glycerol uptake facilitator-like aquaporin
VSLVEFLWGRLEMKVLFSYMMAQITGAILGVWLTHAMFHQPILQLSTKSRAEPHLWLSEVVATFGLMATIALAGRKRVEAAPMSIALYITAAYWFTSSTSFANPAVTIARSLTNTFCGIEPHGVAPFIVAQLVGAIAAFYFIKNLLLAKGMD